MKFSSSVVHSLALQLFLAGLVLAQTSDETGTPFVSVPTQTGLPNSPPGERPGDSSDAAVPTSTRCFFVCPGSSASISLPTTDSFPDPNRSLQFPSSPTFSTTSSSASLPASDSPALGPSVTFPASSSSSATSASSNNQNTISASQLRTQVIIGAIVGLALLGGLAVVVFLLRRRSLRKRRVLTTFALDAEAALPPAPSQKGGGVGYVHPFAVTAQPAPSSQKGGGVGYAHPSAVTAQPEKGATPDPELARKVAELEAQGRRMQEEFAALRRGPTHTQGAKFDVLAARARESNEEPPSYKQVDWGSV
ncbi:hypothetical protein C8R46DRAFT_1082381 [Mycena filopes]|nr:hypothetical protein C8R46DRAFT_1082381 [Mycena filopes]